MKKTSFYLFAVIFGIATLSSCVKVRTCSCKTTINGENGEVSYESYPVSGNKKTAQNTCNAYNKFNQTYTTTCNIN